MGEVYRARDLKLDRDVAIKVLPPSVASDPATLARFEREAKAVAALSHQHILAIHDFGNQDGIAYAVMELLEGETLRAKLDAGPITQKQALDYAVQIARGLSAAHTKGIVHRDLKPENLFVARDGHVKILDFGLAKRVEIADPGNEIGPTRSGHTEPGTVMGTAGYMSPEQVKALPVDHRSDIFSFGAILYELLSGQRAFRRETNVETMAAIMRDEPPELSAPGRNISPALDRIVRHCLEKDRHHRFQSANDIAFSLLEQSSSAASGARDVTAPVSGAGEAMSGAVRAEEGFWVAVLPFTYSGGTAELIALAEGLTEDIVTGLSRFSYLRVIARGSTSRFVGDAADVRTIGRELGARYVMEGSIRQAGASLRVAAQLVDAGSGAHLWAETYRRPFERDHIFEVQDDVAPRIVSTVADMNGVLPHMMSEALRGRRIEELTPYEAVLRSFGYLERLDAEEHAEVREGLERAIQAAPGYADGLAMLSNLHAEEYKHGFNARPDPLGRALDAARRAVAAAPSNHLAYHVLAQALFFRKEFAAFEAAAERAVALNPMDGCTTAYMGILLAYAGNWEHGLALADRAMQLNPLHPGWYRFAAFTNALRTRDYRAALGVALKFNMPTYFYTHAALAAVYGHLGETESAANALRELLEQKPDFARIAREELAKWNGPEVLNEYLEGLRKAGLSIAPVDV